MINRREKKAITSVFRRQLAGDHEGTLVYVGKMPSKFKDTVQSYMRDSEVNSPSWRVEAFEHDVETARLRGIHDDNLLIFYDESVADEQLEALNHINISESHEQIKIEDDQLARKAKS